MNFGGSSNDFVLQFVSWIVLSFFVQTEPLVGDNHHTWGPPLGLTPAQEKLFWELKGYGNPNWETMFKPAKSPKTVKEVRENMFFLSTK